MGVAGHVDGVLLQNRTQRFEERERLGERRVEGGLVGFVEGGEVDGFDCGFERGHVFRVGGAVVVAHPGKQLLRDEELGTEIEGIWTARSHVDVHLHAA